MKRKIYLVCPVRFASEATLSAMKSYVKGLEAQGCEVHYPPRDVDQVNDDGGVRICYEHREAMRDCNEVHFWWDNASKGSHFDAGMAYMLAMFEEVKFVMANDALPVDEKSFQNLIVHICASSAAAENQAGSSALPVDLDRDSGERFLSFLSTIGKEDAKGLTEAYQSYGPSWKSRGGDGAFHMLARKWDRMENRLKKLAKQGRKWDIFYGIATDTRGEGLIDDVRDLRRYLALVEAEMRARGFKRKHRDNTPNIQELPKRLRLTGEDALGLAPRQQCGFVPTKGGYQGCTREKGHEGPCAHPREFRHPSVLTGAERDMLTQEG